MWTVLLGMMSCLYLNPDAYIPLDYHIDRPRVLAIRAELPPDPELGGPVRFDAIAVVPQGKTVEAVSVELCNPSLDNPLYYIPIECFAEPELVTLLGSELPLTWEMPSFESFNCPEAYVPTTLGDSGTPLTTDTGYTYYGYTEDTGYYYDTDYYYYDDDYYYNYRQCNTELLVLVGVTDGDSQGYAVIQIPMDLGRPFYDPTPTATPNGCALHPVAHRSARR